MRNLALIGNAEAFIPRIKYLGFDIKTYSWNEFVDEKTNDMDAAMFFPDSRERNAWNKPS